MTRRNGLIAALVGVLPALSAAQTTYSFSSSSAVADPYVTFNPGKDQISIGWDLKTSELVVQTDGREARISRQQIMDALLAKEEKDATT